MHIGSSHKNPTRLWRYKKQTKAYFLMDSSMKTYDWNGAAHRR